MQEAGDFEQLWRRDLLSQTALSSEEPHAHGSEKEGIYHMFVERSGMCPLLPILTSIKALTESRRP